MLYVPKVNEIPRFTFRDLFHPHSSNISLQAKSRSTHRGDTTGPQEDKRSSPWIWDPTPWAPDVHFYSRDLMGMRHISYSKSRANLHYSLYFCIWVLRLENKIIGSRDKTRSKLKTAHVLHIYHQDSQWLILCCISWKTTKKHSSFRWHLPWSPKSATVVSIIYILNISTKSFTFELVSKPDDCFLSSSAFLARSDAVTYLHIICWDKSSFSLAIFSF